MTCGSFALQRRENSSFPFRLNWLEPLPFDLVQEQQEAQFDRKSWELEMELLTAEYLVVAWEFALSFQVCHLEALETFDVCVWKNEIDKLLPNITE
jgi:hypothetical protein